MDRPDGDHAQAGRFPDFLICGKVFGVYGVKGWVKIRSFTDPQSALMDYQPWFTEKAGKLEAIGVNAVREHGKGLVAQLNDIEDRDLAKALVGQTLWVARKVLPGAEPGEYYWHDIEGCCVVTRDGTHKGTVSYLIDTGGHDVLVVNDGTKETLIPFVIGVYVDKVDLGAQQIVVDWAWD